MAQQEFDPQVISTTLMGVVQSTFKTMCKLEFTKQPEIIERDVIEYDSKMRTVGFDKFQAPCYIASISYYLSPTHMEQHDACGTMNLYIEEEFAERILAYLNEGSLDEEEEIDDEMEEETLLDNCGELCNIIAGNFKNEVKGMGFIDLTMSAPVKAKNTVVEGVDFPYSQYRYFEARFELWQKECLIIDVVMAPIDQA